MGAPETKKNPKPERNLKNPKPERNMKKTPKKLET
jgi:hypothetical protein